MQSYTYPQFPALAHAVLYKNVTNASELRASIVKAATLEGEDGDKAKDAVNFAFVEARMVSAGYMFHCDVNIDQTYTDHLHAAPQDRDLSGDVGRVAKHASNADGPFRDSLGLEPYQQCASYFSSYIMQRTHPLAIDHRSHPSLRSLGRIDLTFRGADNEDGRCTHPRCDGRGHSRTHGRRYPGADECRRVWRGRVV